MSIKDWFTEDIEEEVQQEVENTVDPVISTAESKKEGVKHRYIFPNIMAKWMANVTQKVQYEASMMAMVFILIGVSFFLIYNLLFSASTMAMKVMTVLNLAAVFVFISSSLITQYQQYKTFLDSMETFKEFDILKTKTEVNENGKGEKKTNSME